VQDRERRGTIEIGELERQADERVAPWLRGTEVEPLDHEHPRAEQAVVHRKVAAPELLDRQVVDADRPDATLDQQRGGIQGEIDEGWKSGFQRHELSVRQRSVTRTQWSRFERRYLTAARVAEI
jgi:hypothetical protein